jgi:hypothetical protein
MAADPFSEIAAPAAVWTLAREDITKGILDRLLEIDDWATAGADLGVFELNPAIEVDGEQIPATTVAITLSADRAWTFAVSRPVLTDDAWRPQTVEVQTAPGPMSQFWPFVLAVARNEITAATTRR